MRDRGIDRNIPVFFRASGSQPPVMRPARPKTIRRSVSHNRPVPRVSAFYGIVITMYFRDHPPPHFHAAYAGHVAQIDIDTLEIVDGWLPSRALRLVAEWGGQHHDELRQNWDRARAHQQLLAIDPLP
jgi:hypothetical protein